MKFKMVIALSVLVASVLALVCFGQGPTSRYPFKTTRRASVIRSGRSRAVTKDRGPVEICPPHNCSATVNYPPNPIGTSLDVGDNPVFVLKVCSYNVTGTGSYGCVVIEASPDKQSWMQVAAPQFTGLGTWYIPVSTVPCVPGQVFPGISPAFQIGLPSGISNTAVNQVPLFGPHIRTECFIGNNGSGNFQYQAFVLPGSKNPLR